MFTIVFPHVMVTCAMILQVPHFQDFHFRHNSCTAHPCLKHHCWRTLIHLQQQPYMDGQSEVGMWQHHTYNGCYTLWTTHTTWHPNVQ